MYHFNLVVPVGVRIIPNSISVPENTRFDFVCVGPPGVRLIVTIKADGSRVNTDPRFRVTTYNESTIRIEAPMGLRSSDGMEIE